MITFRTERVLGGVAAIALAALLLPQTSSGTPGSFDEVGNAPVVYFDAEGSISFELSPEAPAPQELGQTSVADGSGGKCSAAGPCSTKLGPGGPCSTELGGPCSTEPATGGPCSVGSIGGPCSVGPPRGVCSVEPTVGQCSVNSPDGPCSVDPGVGQCSVNSPDGPCSAGTPTGAPMCSALAPLGERPCSAIVNRGDPGPHCSVFGSDPTGQAVCSAGGATNPKLCSALCDDGTTCSVSPDLPGATGGGSYCSTFGGPGSAACSVFPIAGSGNAGSICSTGSHDASCSSRGGGNIQVCSAFQGSRAQHRNFCSTVSDESAGLGGGGHTCSVLTEGLPRKGACSTFIKAPVSKFCSAAGDHGACSVLELAKDRYTGKCTSLMWSDPRSCSTFAPRRPQEASGSLQCSVLNRPDVGSNSISCGRASSGDI